MLPANVCQAHRAHRVAGRAPLSRAAWFSPGRSLAGRFNPYQKLGIFSKVLSYIETHYVEDISETELMYGAARGLTDVLDPHSRFMDPEEYDRLKKETEGNEEINGIGIDVEKRKNRLVIISPIEGSPAAHAGIEPGDVIKRVDGVEVGNLEFDDAVSRMQGPPGSEVVLVIDRRGRELTFRLRRQRYELKPVEGRLLEDGIGYVKIRLFAATTDQLLGELLDQLEAQSKGLRGPGPRPAAQPGRPARPGRARRRSLHRRRLAGQDHRQGRARDRRVARPRARHAARLPDDRVVDGATASAAEIVAGALQDHGRAVVLGTQTFGKGSVQTVIDIDGCGPKPCGLKITMARYYTPSGRSIQGQGITPNVVVEATAPPADPTEADAPRERDLQKRLRNEQGENVAPRKRLDDYQLQMAIDYLRSWSVFAKQISAK